MLSMPSGGVKKYISVHFKCTIEITKKYLRFWHQNESMKLKRQPATFASCHCYTFKPSSPPGDPRHHPHHHSHNHFDSCQFASR